MDQERWNKINEVFAASIELEKEERNRFLAKACGNDEALRKEVQLLLDAHVQADDFIENPVFEDAFRAMSQEEDLLTIDQQIGAYKVLKEIGRGGMGTVYLAARADQEYNKLVAIKLIKRGMDTEQVLHRFRNERQILANFDHPNIARLLEGGSTSNGLPYFVMEYVEGVPLDLYCDQNNLSITKRLELFRQVCSAVSYAHQNLVVHRDIKPSNILVTTDGLPKLLDFGIAKILQPHSGERTTATGLMPMTPEYASPEQALGGNVTTYSDIYSLGVLLYELLSGHLPYQLKQASAAEVARIITETRPQAPSTVVNTVVADRTPETVSKCREGTPDRLRRRLRGDLDNIVLMAMRKEPERRYQSVEQFSEDIRRHLEGHPVLARKDTFLYRGTKFVKRNKITAAFAMLTLLSLGIAAFIQWRTNQQAASFQEFGQEVARIEASMRYAYLLPLHNIQPDKQQVLNRLEYIKKRMQDLGGVSYGPGYYSIGRGYLSLHRYQDAYDNLTLAWQKHGYQEPATANALGLSLAMLYGEKLREAEQLYNKDQRTRRKLELEKLYRAPAFEYIQKGATASEAAEYVQALLTFLAKKYPQALKKARAAEQRHSWHYESKKLQGDIFAAMGNDQSSVGNTAGASELYEKAKVAYLEAASKGQSDPQIYDALCSVQSSIQEMLASQKGSSPETVLQQGLDYCEKAIQIDSGDVNAKLLASKLYRDWAFTQSERGRETGHLLQKSENFARDALKTDPESGLAHLALGNVYSTRANRELLQDGNPIPFLDLAEKSLLKASLKMPEDHQLLSVLGNNFLKRGRHEVVRGIDPRPSLEKSVSLIKRALQLDPENSRYFAMLGCAHSMEGDYEVGLGLDCTRSYRQAIEASRRSIQINPSYITPYIWMGLSYLGLANYQIDTGVDTTASLDGALDVYEKALKLDQEQSYSHAGVAIVHWKKAHVLQQAGKDPTAELDLSRESFKKAIQLDSKTVITYALYAEVGLVAARHAISQQKPPETFFRESEEIVRDCFAVNPESVECLETMAALHLLRAEHSYSDDEIDSGLKRADQVLKLHPKNGLVMAYRGRLFLLRAQNNSGNTRQQAAQQAIASFDQAFKTKSLLRREYAKYLEEAKRLGFNTETQGHRE